MSEPALPADWVLLGKIVGVFGVEGWVKLNSDTRPREGIFSYSPWQVLTGEGWQPFELLDGRRQGPGMVARLRGVEDRDQAKTLVGSLIAIPRSQLPPATDGEVYWVDLEGCQVINREGEVLGTVSHLIETGANDVLVVRDSEERLIPYVEEFIDAVDLEAKVIRVDWDLNF